MVKKQIAIIGSGNVATHLGLALSKAGFAIKQVYSLHHSNAQELARAVNAVAIDKLELLHPELDMVIIAVSDKAIPSVVQHMHATKALVVHTAGSVGVEALAKFDNHGVFYPFQTFSKSKSVNMQQVPFLLEANNSNNLAALFAVAQTISQRVSEANSAQRMNLHIAAVFSCNFVNHLYTLAHEILTENQLPFDLLQPLIDETTHKIKVLTPLDAQTGPAVRGDISVIQKHLSMLDDMQIHDLYKLLSQSIIKHKKTKKSNNI